MVQRFGANLSLCSLNGQARMLFEMTEMTSWFNIYPSDPGAEPLEASATVLRPSQFNQNWSFPWEETPVPTLDKV